MHLSSVFCFIRIPLSFVLGCLSHVFLISCIPHLISFAYSIVQYLICFMSRLRLCLNLQAVWAMFQDWVCVSNHVLTSSLQATSHNQLGVTKIEIRDSWRNKMYIERADILYSVELLDQSLMRSVTFNPFINEIFVLFFHRL